MEYTLPNKFFDYLYYCKPMILSDLYVFREIINKHKIGTTVDVHNVNVEKIGNEINVFLKNTELQKRIIKEMYKLRNLYIWENKESKLIDLYNSL